MGDFTALNERQAQLCRECGVDPEGKSVILENETALRMKHHKSGNIVSIFKEEAQRRRERRGN